MKSFLVTQPRAVLWDYLHKRTELTWSTDFRAIGRVVEKDLRGVIGFNSFTRTSCQMHMAGDGAYWASKSLICAAFEYVFMQLGHKVVYGLVPSQNEEALKIDLKLGFEPVVYLDGAHEDGGIHLLQMRRENCRFLRSYTHGREERSRCA